MLRPNSARQLTEISRDAVYDGEVCITPETITEYTRDAAGRVLTTIRRVGPMETTEATEYDAQGRVIKQTDVLGRVTMTMHSADGLTTTVTSPAGATAITTRNTDGSTASISGTAQRALVYMYDLNGNSLRTTTKLADGTTIAQSIVNGFGQTTVQAQASTSGFIYTRSEYNAKGQMTKQYQDTGWNTAKTAATLYEYDVFGNVSKQTLALADSPTKDNSPMVEMAYSVESAEDGVFSVTTQTRYNAEGAPLNSTKKQLISQLSATLESKTIKITERGLTNTQWATYNEGTKRSTYSTLPTSTLTEEIITVDGVVMSKKDHTGITMTATRNYTAMGIALVHVDGRGNVTTSRTDLAGRTISVTNASGAVTTTVYDAAHDLPAVVTDAEGNTACYKYDHRGRKIAEWGTAIQPACFGYDDMGNMTTLRTFRAGTETISSEPFERTDGDVTMWVFHPATGLELSKIYADGTAVVKSYDAYNRLATETDARGNVKTHTYEHARGLHLGTTYTLPSQSSEGATAGVATNARSFTYNHLGQLMQLTDDSGVRSFTYNTYGERERDTLAVDGDTHLITELRDAFGRSTGYIATSYTYSPYGSVTASGSVTQPIQWSSEFNDVENCLFFYNYRHYNAMNGLWLSRDASEEVTGVNLYGFTRNNPIMLLDILGLLDDKCCKDGKLYKEITDDAGRRCCEYELKDIAIQVEPHGNYLQGEVGHAWIQTPNIQLGFYPDSWHRGILGAGDGIVQDENSLQFSEERKHRPDPRNSYTYKACPESIKSLEKNMSLSKQNPPEYSLYNDGDARNCCGWACEIVEKSGFRAPFAPNTVTLAPGAPGQKCYGPGRQPIK